MSSQLTPDEALSTIPKFAGLKCRWQALPGGLTNRSFRVDTAADSFILRLDSAHTADLGLDSALELRIRDNAHRAGLAAAVVHAEEGILLSEYLPGTVWQESDLTVDEKLVELARLLAKVHELPAANKPFSAEQIAAQYVAAIAEDSELSGFAKECQERLAAIPPSESVCCCHNDIVAENIIQNRGLKLLDWEYACDNDPLFDLASLIGFHDLDASQTDTLLGAYSGGADRELHERLRDQVRLFDIIQWLWFAVRYSGSHDAQTKSRLKELRSRLEAAPTNP